MNAAAARHSPRSHAYARPPPTAPGTGPPAQAAVQPSAPASRQVSLGGLKKGGAIRPSHARGRRHGGGARRPMQGRRRGGGVCAPRPCHGKRACGARRGLISRRRRYPGANARARSRPPPGRRAWLHALRVVRRRATRLRARGGPRVRSAQQARRAPAALPARGTRNWLPPSNIPSGAAASALASRSGPAEQRPTWARPACPRPPPARLSRLPACAYTAPAAPPHTVPPLPPRTHALRAPQPPGAAPGSRGRRVGAR